ncbi:MAG: APC family permease [Collinsella sp.]|nr:APC family permease [Collinsella sp.]
MTKKKFRMLDAILTIICVVFVCEAAAPAAAIGNAQYFWWIFLILTFLLPYGLIVCELGTAYADDPGGIADWVRRAFGDTWSSRCAWYYWVNFPLWMASLALLFPETINLITGSQLGLLPSLAIELAFIWIVVLISFSKTSDSAWILNLSAVLKVAVALVLGLLGIWYAFENGFSSDMSIESFLPAANLNSLTYLSIILFNFMGFEAIAVFAGDMENPKKQIPAAIIAGGVTIAAIYLFSSFGIGAAIPADQISLDSGLMEAIAIMVGSDSILFPIVGTVFLATLFGNMVSWSFGVNFVAANAAMKGNMPKFFARMNKNGVPTGSAVVNGVLATALVLLSPVMTALGLDGFFWIFFSMNVVFLLITYSPMFPAFLKLRKIDPDANRIFKVPGGDVALKICALLPMLMLGFSLIATVVPFDGSPEEMSKIPLLIGVLVFAVLGEALRVLSARSRSGDYRGMEIDGDPDSWDEAHGIQTR